MSPAEILDKASILKVKMARLPNGNALEPQFRACLDALRRFPPDRVQFHLGRLYEANLPQWFANESIFQMLENWEPHSALAAFKAVECIKIAHAHNRERVKFKNEIAAEFGGEREEKSYSCSL